jgi:hypothetical protein
LAAVGANIDVGIASGVVLSSFEQEAKLRILKIVIAIVINFAFLFIFKKI